MVEEGISRTTALRWIKDLGFRHQRQGKGTYIDGHERKDVVKYRKSYVKEMVEVEKLQRFWLHIGGDAVDWASEEFVDREHGVVHVYALKEDDN